MYQVCLTGDFIQTSHIEHVSMYFENEKAHSGVASVGLFMLLYIYYKTVYMDPPS